jgi:hypothetical protein
VNKDPSQARAEAELNAELDRVLREIGSEVLEQEIPQRLLRILRSAPGAIDPAPADDMVDESDEPG